MLNQEISEKCDLPFNNVEVLGCKMHYLDVGKGDPILFLHGIPTSSYLWRNIIPYVSELGRCIAPDLIGCGKSAKPDITYSVFDHINYIEAFIKELKLERLAIVMHGLGSIVGFDYAMRHQTNCKGLVFYEAFLRTLLSGDVSLPLQEQLDNLRQSEVDDVKFIDSLFKQSLMRELTEIELKNYREPFLGKGANRPVLQYLHELSNSEESAKVEKLIASYTDALTRSPLPKLMLYSLPGFITTMATVMWAKKNLPNLEVVDIGEELHLGQESNPDLIGKAISVWLQGVDSA